MNQQRDVDSIIATWLDDGPVSLPMDTRRAISVGVRTQPRARRMAFLGGFSMLPLNRVVAATVVVIAVGAGSVLFVSNRSSGPGDVAPPPATPSVTPTAPAVPSPTPELMDTGSWVDYASDRYGFAIAVPGDWRQTPAQRDWSFATDYEVWLHLEATDHFLNPEGDVGVSAWSSPVEPGTTVEAWMEALCTAQGGASCPAIADRAVDVETGDQHPGLALLSPEAENIAYFVDGETVYVVAVWRGETDPSVAPYGGARRLLESFISTMTLPAPSASPQPSS
jgi:hypothetical protein